MRAVAKLTSVRFFFMAVFLRLDVGVVKTNATSGKSDDFAPPARRKLIVTESSQPRVELSGGAPETPEVARAHQCWAGGVLDERFSNVKGPTRAES
jgi:hypothetical protein